MIERPCQGPDCAKPVQIIKQRDHQRKKYCSPSCRQRARWARGDRLQPGVRPMGHFPPKEARSCEACDQTYQPNGARQRWCLRCVPDASARAIMTRYGLTRPAVDAMIERQAGKCALCRTKEPTVVDHDHDTGIVRGMLCDGCNTGLGAFGDDPLMVRRALAYLEEPVALFE